MLPWRIDSFATLREIAKDLEGSEHVEDLREYYELRESNNGTERGRAHQALSQFMRTFHDCPRDLQRCFVQWILAVADRNPMLPLRQLIPKKMAGTLLRPILELWVAEQPGNLSVLRMLGDRNSLENLLALEPDDQAACEKLLFFRIGDLNYMVVELPAFLTNNIPESAEDARGTVLAARRLVQQLEGENCELHLRRIDEIEALIESWHDWSDSGTPLSFREWAVANDRPCEDGVTETYAEWYKLARRVELARSPSERALSQHYITER